MDEAISDQDVDKDAINQFDRILSRLIVIIWKEVLVNLNFRVRFPLILCLVLTIPLQL